MIKALSIVLLICIASTVALFNLTTPLTMGPAGVLMVFILLFIIAFCSVYDLIRLFIFIINYIKRALSSKKPSFKLTPKKTVYYSLIAALALVIIISLKSVGGLNLYSFGLVVALLVIFCAFIKKQIL